VQSIQSLAPAATAATAAAIQARTNCFEIIQAAVESQRGTPPGQQLLQTPAGRMLGGFLISTCLLAAESEVSAGPTGSKAVRQASVRSLGAVVAAVGAGPQLAFALPGLASGLAKQLMASGGWSVVDLGGRNSLICEWLAMMFLELLGGL
jgi:hypothetical protein